MRGLLKNNFYAVIPNGTVFFILMALLGVIMLITGKNTASLMMVYLLLDLIGFSFLSIASIRKESATKWNQYKLTVPVRRSDIIKSYFISQLQWILTGVVFAGLILFFYITLHGVPFDRNMDIFMLFVLGIGVSLIMDALFFPMFWAGGESRNEVFLVISLLCAAGIITGMTWGINILFPHPMSAWQLFLGGMLILGCAFLIFIASCLLTIHIFQQKEY